MATKTNVISGSRADLMRSIIESFGGTPPTSAGEYDLLAAIANQIQAFTPPSGSDIFLAPASAVGQTYDRFLIDTATEATAASGTLQMTAIFLPANTVINNINFITGTTPASGPTHQWAGLYDSSRNLLAISADGLTTAIPASTVLVSPVATVAAGAATSFVTTYSGLYYVGQLITVSTTMPTFQGITSTVTDVTIPPILTGSSSTGLTVPSTFPTQAGVITPTAAALYAYLT